MSKKLVNQLFRITIGTALMAFGVFNFAIHNNMAEGGFTGITILFYQLFGISPSFTNLALNIPMFIIGYKLFSKRGFWLTVYGTVMLSVFLRIFETVGFLIPTFPDDMIIASIGMGVFIGSGLGIIFNAGGTTGGVDIIAKLVKQKLGVPMSQTMFLFDAAVITISFIVFLTIKEAIYTIIGLYIASKIIERFQEGFQAGHKVLIISEKHQEIADQIHRKMNRGATLLHATGSYNKKQKMVVMTIINKRELGPLKDIIYKIDPQAFVSVSHVYETLGEGFTFDQNGIPYFD
ncbi:MAG TPA: YitT family protein [Firmicutes bacterium]|nr:YitT family protein [Bacillota bacterium]